MLRIFSFLLAACLLTSTFSSMAATQSTGERPRRFIFLVHGLHGNVSTFGDLPWILKTHGKAVQPSTDIQVIPFAYNTGSEKTTYQFAHDLAHGMLEEIKDLRPTDRITLVAHSQGGLISWIWYILSLGKEPGYESYHQLALQTEGLMTLGSPIWGSKLATFLQNSPHLKPFATGKGVLGENELGEMAYGSDTIYRFRQRAVQLDQAKVSLPLRILAVGGVLHQATDPDVPFYRRAFLNFAESKLGSGPKFQTESDAAVALPSARFDFIYLKKGTNQLADIKATDFTHFNFAEAGNLKVVRAPHASWSQEKFYDMAEVPSMCADLRDPCTHPTYPLILSFTMACTKEIPNCRADVLDRYVKTFTETPLWKTKISPPNLDAKLLHSFMLDIVLEMPDKYPELNEKQIRNYFRFAIRDKDGRVFNGIDHSYFFRIDRAEEFQSSRARSVEYYSERSSQKLKQIRLTLHGHVYMTYPELGGDPKTGNVAVYLEKVQAGLKLPMIITPPGFASRNVEILVKPTYTTYINLDYKY